MIEVRNLAVTFNAGLPLERRALRGISLRLEPGEFCCVIGSNGAGKSTLLSAIAGDVRASSGQVMIGETEVTSLGPEARASLVARVFQDPLAGSCGNLSIAENLALAASRCRRRGIMPALRRARRALLRERVAELGLGLESSLDQPMHTLSGGQRQMLALVMATLASCRALLLDEHTAALDPRNAESVLALTAEYAARFRLTVLMVTHSMRQALDFGERTVMLHEGQIALDLRGPERRGRDVPDLLAEFRRVRGETVTEDRLLVG